MLVFYHVGMKTLANHLNLKEVIQFYFLQINVLSEEIYVKYFENSMNHIRPVVAKLKDILNDIDCAVNLHNETKAVSLIYN